MINSSGWYSYAEWCGTKTELRDVIFYKENNRYYLDLTYDVETESEKIKLNIPRVSLPIQTDNVQICNNYDANDLIQRCRVNLGFGSLPVELDENDHHYTETVIEEKVHELTITEIEKRLGYKVKIING